MHGAEQIIKAVRQRWPWLKHLFTDGAYGRGRLMSQAAYRDFVIEIVRKLSDQQGFQPLPRRWVVERNSGGWRAGVGWCATMKSGATSPRP